MPFPYSSELVQIMSAKSGAAPVLLLDVLALDGTSYHWSNCAPLPPITPVYPTTLPGTPPAAWLAGLAIPPADYDTYYFPWLLSATGFVQNRAMQSVTATIEVQNVSGNTLQRDLAGLLTARTFEGALFALREYNLTAQAAEFEQHGRLTILSATEMECQFGANELFNPNDYDGNPYAYSETCQWQFGSPQCGSTAGNDSAFATPCDNTYTTCHQPNRFGGDLQIVVFPQNPNTAQTSTNAVVRNRLV